MGTLEQEYRHLHKTQATLQAQYPAGGFVAIKGSEVLGVWSSEQQAIKGARQQVGQVPVLVESIFSNDQAAPIFSGFLRMG